VKKAENPNERKLQKMTSMNYQQLLGEESICGDIKIRKEATVAGESIDQWSGEVLE